jgi:hypothetical protein
MKGTVSCAGKRSYADFHTARRMAERTNKDRDTATQPYRCSFCHRWHVGSHAPNMKRPVVTDAEDE